MDGARLALLLRCGLGLDRPLLGAGVPEQLAVAGGELMLEAADPQREHVLTEAVGGGGELADELLDAAEERVVLGLVIGAEP